MLDLKRVLEDAGLVDVDVAPKAEIRKVIKLWMLGSGAEDYMLSAIISRRKLAWGRHTFGYLPPW